MHDFSDNFIYDVFTVNVRPLLYCYHLGSDLHTNTNGDGNK